MTEAAGTTGNQQQGATPAASGATPDAGNQPGATPADFDAWLAGQDDAVKGVVGKGLSKLSTALESERGDRKAVVAQLKALQAEGDPAKQKQQIAELQATLAEQTVRNEFAEEAHAQGVTNIRLAYLAAKDGELLGKPKLWEKLKESSPELFQKKVVGAGNAGHGSGAQPGGAPTMNDFIRGYRGA